MPGNTLGETGFSAGLEVRVTGLEGNRDTSR